MIKAVFFDLFNTLVRYEPPREEIEAKVLHDDFGIEVSAEVLRQPMQNADDFIYNEIARRPLRDRSREEKTALYAQYQEMLLREAGVKPDQKLVLAMMGKMQQVKLDLALFADVKPALDNLKSRGLILGLISNIEQDLTATFDKLDLSSQLKIVVTSQEAGANKPKPEIFRFALHKAGIRPDESIYVGDQYQVDILGASGVGMKAILLDRTRQYEDIADFPRIQSLAEIAAHL